MTMIIAETIDHDEKAKHLTMIMEAEFDQCKVEEVVNDHSDNSNQSKVGKPFKEHGGKF